MHDPKSTSSSDLRELEAANARLRAANDELARRDKERAVLHEQLVEQHRLLQAANRMKSDFLANMSHELRTPLNAILGFSEIMIDGIAGPTTDQQREYLGDVLESGRHLLSLINDILDLAKVESGKMEFNLERVELSPICKEVCDILRAKASAKRIRVESSIEASLEWVEVDPGKLKQILYNYLSNALKFTEPGGHIGVRFKDVDADYFRMEVEDSGPGIDAADLPRLFVEFQQLDSGTTRKHPGSGLGLVLTKRMTEAQGGSVAVVSEKGVGSTFSATLPKHVRIDDGSTPIIAGPVIALAPDAPKVLVVEDDSHDRSWVVRTLCEAGYWVESVASGNEALSRCSARVYDVITLDLLLPDQSGFEVLHKIRTQGLNREVPIVVMSVVAEKHLFGGFAVHDALTKPATSDQLLDALRTARVSPTSEARVLVVDDDRSTLKRMEILLQDLGYRPLCFQDAREALKAANKENLSAVIVDLMMPEVDGFEFLSRLRALPHAKSIPVVVWTTNDLSSSERQHLSSLAEAVVLKNAEGHASLLEHLRRVVPRSDSHE